MNKSYNNDRQKPLLLLHKTLRIVIYVTDIGLNGYINQQQSFIKNLSE
jgi:hypothetical protein